MPAYSETILKSQLSSAVRSMCDFFYFSIFTIPRTIVYKPEGEFRDDIIRRDLNGCMITISGLRSDLSCKPSLGDLILKFLSDKGLMEEVSGSVDGSDGTFLRLLKMEFGVLLRDIGISGIMQILFMCRVIFTHLSYIVQNWMTEVAGKYMITDSLLLNPAIHETVLYPAISS